MTRLLVSVRDADEARAALAGGADLIDIKEPSRGALGAADLQVWREVLEVVKGRVPVSAALGELADGAWRELVRHAQGLTFVKAGLAKCATSSDWQTDYRQLRDALPRGTALVAVAYADAEAAAAPPVEEVLEVAIALELPALLVDTFDKSRGDLWSTASRASLWCIIARAHERRVRVALAGSLTIESFHDAQQLAPDWLAVRGAVCDGGRAGVVAEERVFALKKALTHPQANACGSPDSLMQKRQLMRVVSEPEA